MVDVWQTSTLSGGMLAEIYAIDITLCAIFDRTNFVEACVISGYHLVLLWIGLNLDNRRKVKRVAWTVRSD
jgi:hypothetical protein